MTASKAERRKIDMIKANSGMESLSFACAVESESHILMINRPAVDGVKVSKTISTKSDKSSRGGRNLNSHPNVYTITSPNCNRNGS